MSYFELVNFNELFWLNQFQWFFFFFQIFPWRFIYLLKMDEQPRSPLFQRLTISMSYFDKTNINELFW